MALFAILAMLTGFFFSRAVLSMAMMLFGLNALIGVHPKQWLKNRWWLLGMLWVGCYFLSWFWSNDPGYWNTRVQVKLPVMLLPLAFAFTPAFTYRQLKIFTMVLVFVLLAGAFYSLSFLITDPEHYIKGYMYSHVLPTLPENDHIRFSLAVTGGIIWCVYFIPQIRERWLKWLGVATVIFLALYLHILAARTGLVAFYIFIAFWTLYLSIRKKTRLIGISLIVLFSAGAFAAVKFVPTLMHRVYYLKYTIEQFRDGQRTGNYSDMGRVISYDIALRLIRERPLQGVGAGNILDTMKRGYDRWYPQVTPDQRLIPHNQFLTVGVACGIPAMIIFIIWVVYPVWTIRRNRAGFFFLITWAVMLIPLLVEPVLEVQYGVFVYLFFLLWQYQAMRRPAIADDPKTKIQQ